MIARNQRRQTANQYGSSMNLNNERESGNSETNLAVVLVGITTMHLLCHALRVFLAVYAVSEKSIQFYIFRFQLQFDVKCIQISMLRHAQLIVQPF